MDVAYEQERLDKALDALGKTPDEVAATLRAGWVTGYRGESGGCPIARYVKAQTGLYACVTHEDAWMPPDGEEFDIDKVARADLPRPVAEFVKAFDEGRYSDLAIKEPEVPYLDDPLPVGSDLIP